MLKGGEIDISLPKLLLQFAKSLESRQFSNAIKTYESIKSNLGDDQWSLGYIRSLRGTYLVKKHQIQHSFFGRKDLEVEQLKESAKLFFKYAKNNLYQN